MTETIAMTAPRLSRISVALTSISSRSSVFGSVNAISPRFANNGSSRSCARNDVKRASFARACWFARAVGTSALKRRCAEGFMEMI